MDKLDNKGRRIVLTIVLGAIFLVFFCTLVKIQIIDAEKYSAAGSVSSRMSVIPATRGEILDRNGNPLVTNRQGNSIVF